MQQAIADYYAALGRYGGLDVTHETAIRSAMQNLLMEAGREVGWTLIPEYRLPNGKTPDGTFLDTFRLRQGYWEAKDTRDDLDTEIKKKFDIGYPADNILFEDSRRAVLYQGRGSRSVFDLTKPQELRDLLRQFTSYAAPETEKFREAVREFKARIPEQAQKLMERIAAERQANATFTAAFAQFHELCKSALNPQVSAETIEEMLVQHLLTERLFRTIFDNPDFTRRNVIAAEIETVIDALTRRAFNRQEFLRPLDRYYAAIESYARTIPDWNEKQSFLNQVYESFFQGFSTKQADTHGIVYTPQEIVSFMLASVEHLLKTEFGSSLSAPGVKILDPCTGTGNFMVNLIKHHLTRRDLKQKVTEDLFANEIMLLPYYIASLNIEHEVFAQAGEYLPFEGMCFADTLSLAEGVQPSLFAEENSERTQREQDAPITVILGNPPYNVGQQNENDNNKNRRYPVVDKRIAETYAKASKATLNTKLYDAYVKFFRWATDRLQGRDGIVCFVSNNSFLEQIAFDGMRKHLLDDFTTIYHLDCGGNVRKNPKLSGTTHNVFGIQVGVGITILVRRRGVVPSPPTPLPDARLGSLGEGRQTQVVTSVFLPALTDNEVDETYRETDCLPSPCEERANQGEGLGVRVRLLYHALPPMARATERLAQIREWNSIENVVWQTLTPDAKGNWLTEGMQADFDSFLPLGTKEGKALKSNSEVIFQIYSLGVSTNRDSIVYDFDRRKLSDRVQQFIEAYNAEVSRWLRAGRPKDIDNFVSYGTLKWSEHLKSSLLREQQASFNIVKLRWSMYRPFCKQALYYDGLLNDRPARFSNIFPLPETESINLAIWIKTGTEVPMYPLITNIIPNLLPQGGSQCFPFYLYDEDGTNRRENITDWALEQFREAHGPEVTKWDIFHYVYALLHDPVYRSRYAENLKRELPRIPLEPPPNPLLRKEGETDGSAASQGEGENLALGAASREGAASSAPTKDCPFPVSVANESGIGVGGSGDFRRYVAIGKELMRLHLDYENAAEYRLEWVENRDVPFSWRVEKMKLSKDKTQLVVNESLTLAGIPPETFDYRLGNRSALEWVIDQYQVTTDKRSGIVSDPNRADDPEYIVRLVGKVITASLETVRLVGLLRAKKYLDIRFRA